MGGDLIAGYAMGSNGYWLRAKVLCVALLLCICPMSALCFDVVIIKSANIAPYNEAEKGFRAEVGARIRTVVITKSLDDEQQALDARLSSHPADMLFVIGEKALSLVTPYVNKIPIVFSYVFDPESVLADVTLAGDGVVAGVRMTVPPEKQLIAFKDAVPGAKRIGIVYDPSKTKTLVDRVNVASSEIDVSVITKKIDSSKDVVDAIESLANEVDGILMLPDTTFINSTTLRYLFLFSFRNKIPLIGLSEKHVKNGAFLGLSFENVAMGKQAGRLAMKLSEADGLAGLIIEEPEVLSISINRKTAEKLNVDVNEKFVGKVDVTYD